jgi:hypothetical protein
MCSVATRRCTRYCSRRFHDTALDRRLQRLSATLKSAWAARLDRYDGMPARPHFSHPDVQEAGAAAVSWKTFRPRWLERDLDCALIGVFGLFIVPLYALILQRSSEPSRASLPVTTS